MQLTIDNKKFEVAPPADSTLESKLWNRLERLPGYLPDCVNDVQFLTAAAAAANDWYRQAKNQAVKKGITVDVNSLTKCVFNAAVVGLPIIDSLGLAHLVPMHVNKNKNGGWIECQLWMGYKGYIELARDANVIDTITPEIVWDDEEFDHYNDENGPHVLHRPSMDRPDKIAIADIKAAYVISKTPRGNPDFEIVKGSTLRNLAKRGNVWRSNPVEMAKKSPIRRIAKRWPQTNRLAAAVRQDEQAEAGETQSALASYDSGAIDTSVVTAAITKVPDWETELSGKLEKCQTAADVDAVSAECSDNKEAIELCEKYKAAAGLVEPEAKREVVEPAPKITEEHVMAGCKELFDSVEPDQIEAKAAQVIKKYPQFKSVIELFASLEIRKRTTPDSEPERIELEPGMDPKEFLKFLAKSLAACTTEEEVENIQGIYLDQSPQDAATMESVYSMCDARVEELEVAN